MKFQLLRYEGFKVGGTRIRPIVNDMPFLINTHEGVRYVILFSSNAFINENAYHSHKSPFLSRNQGVLHSVTHIHCDE